MEDFEREVKVLVLGSAGAGKSTLCTRLCGAAAAAGMLPQPRSVGAGFLERSLSVPALGEDVRLACTWESSAASGGGHPELGLLRAGAAADAAAIVFSTCDRASLEAAPAWHRAALARCGPAAACCLVQAKADLLGDRAAVAPADAEAMARRLGLRLFRVCAPEGLGVEAAFAHLADLAVRRAAAGGSSEGGGGAGSSFAGSSSNAGVMTSSLAGGYPGSYSSSGGGGSSSGGGAAVVEVNKSPGSGKAAKPRKTLGQRVGKAAGKVAKMLAIKS